MPAIDLASAIRIVTGTPAQVAGLDDRDEIAIGTRSDLMPTYMTRDISLVRTGRARDLACKAGDKRQAATSHNLDEPLISALRPAGVIAGKLSFITTRRRATSCSRTNRFRVEAADAGTRSAFNVSH